MMNKLAMRLFSTRMITAQVASEWIGALSDFEQGLFRPERFGDAEPLRKPFAPANITEAIGGLSRHHGVFMYEQGRPVRILGIIWNLYSPIRILDDHSGGFVASHPPPLFCSHWTFNFDGKWVKSVGLDKVVGFTKAMFDLSRADFGFLTSLDDLMAKNYTNGMTRQGLDPARAVPGLYWMNLFSRRYAEWLDLDRLPDSIESKAQLPGNSVALRFGASPDASRDPDVIEMQGRAIQLLGEHRFFDIRQPNHELEAPDWAVL
jgi:hypothetical protein